MAFMQVGRVVEPTSTLALHAARLSAELKIPMAHRAMLATTRATGPLLWTQVADFEGIEGVKHIQAKEQWAG
jgi:hypothetical protein